MKYIDLGTYVETVIDFISDVGEPVFDLLITIIEFAVNLFYGLLHLFNPFVLIVCFSILAYFILAGRKNVFTRKGFQAGIGVSIFTLLGLFLLWGMGFWDETLQTFALVITAAFISLAIGIPLGILTAKSNQVERVIRPILDFMQTMPAFVYLIPAILFFSVGNVPGVVATVVFSLPPAVRLTNLGIRNVPKDVVDASTSFGCTSMQLLFKVQIPLAMPTILAGINQVIMLALSMVVIASMVGAGGLGQQVYKGILQANIGLGFEAGLGIVIIAIFLDRITQALGSSSSNSTS